MASFHPARDIIDSFIRANDGVTIQQICQHLQSSYPKFASTPDKVKNRVESMMHGTRSLDDKVVRVSSDGKDDAYLIRKLTPEERSDRMVNQSFRKVWEEVVYPLTIRQKQQLAEKMLTQVLVDTRDLETAVTYIRENFLAKGAFELNMIWGYTQRFFPDLQSRFSESPGVVLWLERVMNEELEDDEIAE